MYTNNYTKNEYDILLNTQMRADALITETKECLQKPRLTKLDKLYICENLYTEINNILNIAFNNAKLHDYVCSENIKNKILPENYIKPDKQYMELLQLTYSMTDKQFKLLLEKAKEIKG